MTGPDIRARRVGLERQPIAIIDGFSPGPDILRQQARDAAFSPARDHYPGIRAALPQDYFQTHAEVFATVLMEVFGATRPARVLDGSFSLATTPPDALSLHQRLPHIDATAPGRIALVQYLSPHPTAGTAFFRHRSTGFEGVDAARSQTYLETLNAELASGPGPGQGYIHADTALFERIDAVDAVYNRAVMYRSNRLHSGAIEADTVLSADPAVGRLTVTAFLSLD